MVNYRKQGAALILGQLSSLVITFIMPVVLTRILSQDDYGYYSQFNTILTFSATFFYFGISSELYFLYPNSQSSDRRVLIIQAYLLLIVFSIIAFLLVSIGPLRKQLVDNEILNSNSFYLSIAIFAAIPTNIITALYVLKNDNRTSILYPPISTLIRAITVLFTYAIYPSVKSLFLGLMLSEIFKFLYVAFYTIKIIGVDRHSISLNYKIFKKQLNYSIPLGCASSLRVLSNQIDRLISLSFISASSYAIYSIAFYGVPGLNQMYYSITQIYVPRMVLAFNNGKMSEVTTLYQSMISKTLSYTIPVVIVFVLFADVIIPFVFSNKYIDSIPFFKIYLITYIFSVMGNGLILRSIGKTKKTLNAYLYSLIIVVPITYFLVREYMLNGAIIGAVLSSLLPRVFLTYYDVKYINTSIRALLPWRNMILIITSSLLCLLPIIIIKSCFNINIVGALFLGLFYLLIVLTLEIIWDVFIVPKHEVMHVVKEFYKKCK